MKNRRRPVRRRAHGPSTVVSWILAGTAVASSTAALAMSAVALRRVVRQDQEQGVFVSESADYTSVRISAAGDSPRVARVPPLHAVAAVPPENPHAPPTPPVGNPIVER